MPSPDGGFRTGFAALAAVVGVGAFLTAIVLSSFEGQGRFIISAGNDSYSYSAVGHRALVEALTAAGAPIEIKQNRRPGDAGSDDVVLFLEPGADDLGGLDYGDDGVVAGADLWKLDIDAVSVIALPKRFAVAHPANPRRVMSAPALDVTAPQALVDALFGGADAAPTLKRVDAATIELGHLSPGPDLADAQLLPVDAFDRPLAWSDEGAVAGYLFREGRRVLLVTDPDVFANFMMDEENASGFAARLIDTAASARGRILVDEEIHGFGLDPNLVRAMLAPPFLQANLAVFVAALFAVWTGLVRVGPPLSAAPRDLDTVDAPLMDASAELVVRAGDYTRIADRYAVGLLRRAATVLHVRDGRSDGELVQWASDVERSRGMALAFSDLRNMAASASTSATARAQAVHSLRIWYEEITHGSGTRRPAG